MLASSECGRGIGRDKGQTRGKSKGKSKSRVKKGKCFNCHQKEHWKQKLPISKNLGYWQAKREHLKFC